VSEAGDGLRLEAARIMAGLKRWADYKHIPWSDVVDHDPGADPDEEQQCS